MDRFYRWKVSQLGDSFTHINQYDDLLIPTSEVMCQCKNKATHIFSFAAREEYVCKSCGEENCKRYKDMPSFTYFCLSFEEVANLDKLICPNLRSYTEKEAIVNLHCKLTNESRHIRKRRVEILRGKNLVYLPSYSAAGRISLYWPMANIKR